MTSSTYISWHPEGIFHLEYADTIYLLQQPVEANRARASWRLLWNSGATTFQANRGFSGGPLRRDDYPIQDAELDYETYKMIHTLGGADALEAQLRKERQE